MRYDCIVTGGVIRKLRQEKALSQEVLSGLAGISRSHLAMIESGKKSANVNTLWSIADALQIPLSQLIYLVEIDIASNGGNKT